MPRIFRAFGLVFAIYPDDHDLPHVHVLGAAWQAKIALGDTPDLVSIRGAMTRQDARKVLKLASELTGLLLDAWRDIHD